jgi:hypothetical protein
MIDPDFWLSENVARLTIQQRYLFIGLFSNADDQGRLRGHAALIRNAVFPFDDISLDNIRVYLEAIATIGSIILYQSAGKDYIQIAGWWSYQKLQWAYPSDIPAPQGWKDRLRYRQDNAIIKENWDGESDSDNDGDNTPGPEPEIPPVNGNGLGKDLPNGLGKDLGKPTELELELESVKQDDDNARAEFWTVYQTEIGAVSPIIADRFNAYFSKDIPVEWMIDSVAIAAENNVRKASYVYGCIDKAIETQKAPRMVFEKRSNQNGNHKNSSRKVTQQQTISEKPWLDITTNELVYPGGRRAPISTASS